MHEENTSNLLSSLINTVINIPYISLQKASLIITLLLNNHFEQFCGEPTYEFCNEIYYLLHPTYSREVENNTFTKIDKTQFDCAFNYVFNDFCIEQEINIINDSTFEFREQFNLHTYEIVQQDFEGDVEYNNQRIEDFFNVHITE